MNPMENPPPGTCFKFTVGSAEEAAALIRERLGPDARVLSVRSIEQTGLRSLFGKPKLEVIAQIAAPQDGAAEAADPAEGSEGEDDLAAAEMPPAGNLAPADDGAEAAEAPAPHASAAWTPSGLYSGARPTAGNAPRVEPIAPERPRPNLAGLLRRSGLSEMALGRLQAAPFWAEASAQPLHRALVDIGAQLRRQAEERWSGAPLRRAAFLGTPGSGRTTALCKWLGLEVFRRARAGHVVTVEFDRPNPPGALPVFCEALGVPVARFPASTEPAVPNGFVYLDLPGLSVADPRANRPLARFLDEERISERVLVLNAAYDHACLRAAYTAARDLGATHVVFTHLDEVTQWGRLWDYLLDGALEPLFLGTGPTLTGDCEDDVFGALVRRTLAPTGTDEPAGEATPLKAARA